MRSERVPGIDSFFQRFRQFSAFAARVPSVVYAGLYFACIPVFATVYSWFPDDFYHATIKYESSLKDDSQDILNGIKEEMVKGCISSYRKQELKIKGWKLSVNDIVLKKLAYEDEKFTFRIEIVLVKEDGQESLKSHALTAVINRRFAAILPKNTEGTEWTYYHYVNANGDELVPFDALVLFPLTIGSPQARTRFIQITEPLFDKMNAYAHAHEGFPGRSSGSWWRMFYLSAATVTTLGYGDITPISPTTRFLTSLEAILGVLFVGLFLTALSYEAFGNQPASAPA